MIEVLFVVFVWDGSALTRWEKKMEIPYLAEGMRVQVTKKDWTKVTRVSLEMDGVYVAHLFSIDNLKDSLGTLESSGWGVSLTARGDR